MPELPEVETIRRYLDTLLPGREIDMVRHLDGRMVKHSLLGADEMCARLPGLTVEAILRAGKFLFLRFTSQDLLLLHLGMSGRLVAESRAAAMKPHTHLILQLGEIDLRLTDPRRFGRVAWVGADGIQALGLGPDPLSREFTGARLQEVFAGRTVAVKNALLNQSLIAGLGNIYADEALYLSRIHPLRAVGSLSGEQTRHLVRAIRQVLRVSLENGGTSFSDYVNALGHPGNNQRYLKVYGREGLPCSRCHQPISRIVIGGRSSHFCGQCQAVDSLSDVGANCEGSMSSAKF